MNIGIIVYSQTGNTLSVAKKLEERLSAAGHSVNLEQVTVAGAANRETGISSSKRSPMPGPTMQSCSVPQWRPSLCRR